MSRTTIRDLEGVVALINRMAGQTFTLGYAYGGVRLEGDDGSTDVSPRLSKGEMLEWLHAFTYGLEYAKERGSRAGPMGATGTLGEHVPDPSPTAKAAHLNLDVAAPDQLPGVLRKASERFAQDAEELDSAHQTRSAGRPWRKIARVLDAAADRIAKFV